MSGLNCFIAFTAGSGYASRMRPEPGHAGYGAELVRYDRYTQDREDLGRELAAARPIVFAAQLRSSLAVMADLLEAMGNASAAEMARAEATRLP